MPEVFKRGVGRLPLPLGGVRGGLAGRALLRGLAVAKSFAICRCSHGSHQPLNIPFHLVTFGAVRKRRHYRGELNHAGMVTRARELRINETPAESCLWSKLRNRQLHGFKFRRQHQFGNYITDFYCHEAQLVIECDGLVHDTNEAWQHDQTRDAYMIGQGLRVLRFSNDEVLNDTEAVLRTIAAVLAERAKRFPSIAPSNPQQGPP
jgi:very-short-patch-repair endonuclease